MKKICNCNIPANLQKDMMTESIAAYVASLPAESIVDDDEYERRLAICSRCDDLVGDLHAAIAAASCLREPEKNRWTVLCRVEAGGTWVWDRGQVRVPALGHVPAPCPKLNERKGMIMEINEKNGNLYVSGIEDFHLAQTLECGQCFHFEKVGENDYFLSAKGRFLHICQQEDCSVIFYDTDKRTFEDIWVDYFDLERDYGAIKRAILRKDDKLKAPMDMMWGIRILNQSFFETMISFIISQNKQIPHIKKIVSDLSVRYGSLAEGAKKEYERDSIATETSGEGVKNKGVFYNFPSAKKLIEAGEEGLKECKTGFRAPYIMDACRRFDAGELDEKMLRGLDYESVMCELMKVHGIGEKVANCIALFGLSKRNAFPVDVWIKRIMEELYIGHEADKKEIGRLAQGLFGEYGGYAQQYLFYYGKELKIGKETKNQ